MADINTLVIGISLSPAKQWKFLTAAAKVGEVSEPTGATFL